MSVPVYIKSAMTTMYRQHTHSGVKNGQKIEKLIGKKKKIITSEVGEGGSGVKLNDKERNIWGWGETRRIKEGTRR